MTRGGLTMTQNEYFVNKYRYDTSAEFLLVS